MPWRIASPGPEDWPALAGGGFTGGSGGLFPPAPPVEHVPGHLPCGTMPSPGLAAHAIDGPHRQRGVRQRYFVLVYFLGDGPAVDS